MWQYVDKGALLFALGKDFNAGSYKIWELIVHYVALYDNYSVWFHLYPRRLFLCSENARKVYQVENYLPQKTPTMAKATLKYERTPTKKYFVSYL